MDSYTLIDKLYSVTREMVKQQIAWWIRKKSLISHKKYVVGTYWNCLKRQFQCIPTTYKFTKKDKTNKLIAVIL